MVQQGDVMLLGELVSQALPLLSPLNGRRSDILTSDGGKKRAWDLQFNPYNMDLGTGVVTRGITWQ